MDLKQVQAAMKAAVEAERHHKNYLAQFIGENKGVHLPDGSRVQWVRPKPTDVTDWEALAHAYLNVTTEAIAEFTKPQPNTPYIRLYEASKNQKRLSK